MIYIFDDRVERRESYSALINNNKQFVSFAIIECETINELEHFILNNLQAPSLILLHSSYRYPGDKLNSDEVISVFSKLKIPIIIFSGGFMHSNESMALGKYKVYNINSLVMYHNLEYYLAHLMQNQSASVDILLWGESYIQNKITRTQSDLYRKLCTIAPESKIDSLIDDLYETIEDDLRDDAFKRIRNNLLKAISSQMTCDDAMAAIQSVTDKKP